MKGRKTLYLALVIVGLCLVIAALILREADIPDSVGGALMGSGSGLAAMGLAQLLTLRAEQKDPVQARKKEIEVRDERNVAIRRRAKALSGDALQWAILAAAWVSIGFDAPLWVTMAAVVVFVLKSVLEVCLMVQYQQEM